MKKLAILFLAFSFAACGGDDDDDNGGSKDCVTENAERCTGTVLERCEGGEWTTVQDCASSDQICEMVEGLENQARCADEEIPGEEFAYCTAGSCAEGLTCTQVVFFAPTGGVCLVDCESDANVCQTGYYCEPGMFDESDADTAFASNAFCFPVAERNGLCIYNDDGCSDDLSCVDVTREYNPTCKLVCSGEEPGSSPAVCDGETCLPAGPYVEVETDANGDDVNCSTPGEVDNCTAAEGYACMELQTGETTFENFCARPTQLCGSEAQLAGTYASTDDLLDFLNSDNALCELTGEDVYCPVGDLPADSEAEMTCASTGYVLTYQEDVPCDENNPYSCFGYGQCGNLQDGKGPQCFASANVCVAYCTSADGLEELSCGTGWECVAQGAAEVGLPAIQYDANDNPQTCTETAECLVGDGFECNDELGGYCTKPRKVCQPIQ